MLNEQDSKFDGNVKAAQEKIMSDDNGEIDFEEFRMLARDYPLMLQPAFELQDKMHTHTLGGKDWVGVMETISHGETMESIEETQFGKPVKVSSLTSALQSLGLARRYRRVDLRYINSMRPSRHGYEKEDPFKEDDAQKASQKEVVAKATG